MASIDLRSRPVLGASGVTRTGLVGAVALFACAFVDPAAAASAVTFVARLGTDSGTCTRAAPCRSFQYALDQTNAGGVVSALDPAGYGAVTITKSVTLAGPGKGSAAITPRGGSNIGVSIQAPGATVVLRGLQIDGGFDGIQVGQAAAVIISDTVVIRSSNLAINASDTGAKVLVQDTSVLGAQVDTNAVTFVAKRVTVSESPGVGLRPLAGLAVLDDCTISGSSSNVATFGGTTIVKHCTLSFASNRGVSVETNSRVYFDRTTTFGNGVGIDTVGPTFSYGNNNFPDGTGGAITPIAGD